MNEVAKLQPSRLPIASSVAKEFDLAPAQWRVLVEQIFPTAKSVEAVTMALSYCRARNLDIYKKPVHIVPMWNSQLGKMVETVWPGISEIRTTAARTGEYAGIDATEFGPMVKKTFKGSVKDKGGWKDVSKKVEFPEWASVVVYRIVKGVRCAYHAKIFWEETYATVGKGDVPNDMWEHRPRGQLDKCVEAAALRKAFPEELGSTYAAEEMEGRVIDGHVEQTIVSDPTPPPPPPVDDVDPSPSEPKTIEADYPDIPEDLDRREKAGADSASIEPEPEDTPDNGGGAEIDPDAYLNDLEARLATVGGPDDIDELAAELEGVKDKLFPPDVEKAEKMIEYCRRQAE